MSRIAHDIMMLQRRSNSISPPNNQQLDVPPNMRQSNQDNDTINSLLEKLIKATQRQATFLSQPFTTVANVPLLLRQKEDRTYFLIQNTGANTLFMGFDFQPTATNGLNIGAGAFAEPYQVPTNDIWLMSTLATTGILIYSIGN